MRDTHILAVCPTFPRLGEASDGMAEYVTQAGRALAEHTGARLSVAALGLTGQPAEEESESVWVRRVVPESIRESTFGLYHPEHFDRSMTALATLAVRAARSLPHGRTVGWCHGYESGLAAQKLRERGMPVVGVSHYTLLQDTLAELDSVDDPACAPFVASRAQRAAGRLLPRPLRLPTALAVGSLAATLARVVNRGGYVRARALALSMERTFLRSSDEVVAVSRNYARTLGGFYPWIEPRLRWCHAGAPSIATEPRRPSSDLRVLIAARPAPQKGLPYAIGALHELERHRPDLASRMVLRVAGGLSRDEPHPSLLLRGFESLRHVRFENVGHVSRERMRALYADTDVLLVPSVFEPFGLVLLEGIAAGCLVVASDADGPREIVSPDWGWLVPYAHRATRVGELASALIEACEVSEIERERRVDAARRTLRERTWEACARVHAGAIDAARVHAGASAR